MDDKLMMKEGLQTIQIITRRIDPTKLDDEQYYLRLRRWLRKRVKESDLTLIHFIPTKPITERWMVALLLDLQMEFTEILIFPKTEIKEEELQEWFSYFNPVQVLKIK